MRADELIRRIEAIAPPAFQASWDKSGVQVLGGPGDIERLAVTLDPTPQAVAEALDAGAGFILSHHPVSLSPGLPDQDDAYREVLRLALSAEAWVYAAHTSLDVNLNGPVAWLSRDLGLGDLRLIEPVSSARTCEICFEHADESAPWDALRRQLAADDTVASFRLAAGSSSCVICDAAAQPAICGRIESILGRRFGFVVTALEHPRRAFGFGQIGTLPRPMGTEEFLNQLSRHLPRDFVTLSGPDPEAIERIAVCPGSGGSLISRAFALGADVFVTGDVKYHQALEAPGLVVDVGHFQLESEMMRRFAMRLERELTPRGVDILFIPGTEPFRLRALAPAPGAIPETNPKPEKA